VFRVPSIHPSKPAGVRWAGAFGKCAPELLKIAGGVQVVVPDSLNLAYALCAFRAARLVRRRNWLCSPPAATGTTDHRCRRQLRRVHANHGEDCRSHGSGMGIRARVEHRRVAGRRASLRTTSVKSLLNAPPFLTHAVRHDWRSTTTQNQFFSSRRPSRGYHRDCTRGDPR